MNRRAGLLLFALFWALPASRADADEPPSEHVSTSENMSEGSFLPPAVAYGGLCLLVALGAGLALRRRR